MNNRQKRFRAFLAVVLVLALLIALAIVLAVNCSADFQNAKDGEQSRAGILVSEILISNDRAVHDPMGTYSDYVELYNATDKAVSLSGYGLTDNETDVWIIGDGVTIEPNGYVVIWCAGSTKQASEDAARAPYASIVADFALSDQDVLRFVDRKGVTQATIALGDIAFPNNGYCYDVETKSWFNTMAPTPGYPNTAEGLAAYTESKAVLKGSAESVVRVTEFMASNGSSFRGPNGDYGDWIELYNNSDKTVDLTGYCLSDDASKPHKFEFTTYNDANGQATAVTIAPYSYLLVYSTDVAVDGAVCVSFGLSASGESLLFTTPDDGIIDQITFDAQQQDFSMARQYKSDGTFDPDGAFAETNLPTPGYPNTDAGRADFELNESQKQQYSTDGVYDICLNEILVNGYHIVFRTSSSTNSQRPYDADFGSWIELYNKGDTAFDLSGFSLTDEYSRVRKWVFPDGTSIAAKGYLVLQLEGSLPRDGQSESDITEEQRKLTLSFDIAASGESLFLFAPDGTLADQVDVPRSVACVSYGRDASGAWKLFSYSEANPATEGKANPTSGRDLYCAAVGTDTLSGVYTMAQTVNFTVPDGCYATYTTDCSTPTESSTRVNGPIAVTKNTVLRVVTFDTAGARYQSEVQAFTYVIADPNNQTVESHTTDLPIVFLVTDAANLWDADTGIYIKGNDYTGTGDADEIMIGTNETMGKWANFNMSGRTWERPANFTYAVKNAETQQYSTEYACLLNIRIFGAFSRKLAQKGIALIARKGVGVSSMNYAFFDNRPFTTYKSLVLRASGQDSRLSRIRDPLVQSLLEDAETANPTYNLLATQSYIQCVVYLNGQYWGVYNLREKISKHYIAQHYSIQDEDTIDMLVGNGNNDQCVVSGDGLSDYKALIQYCKDHNYDLSDPTAYAYVCSQIDVENFAMYCAFQIIVGNTDTGNIKFWRSSELDNKWRWVVYDFCWAMNGNNDAQEAAYSSGYRRDFFTRYFDPEGHGSGKGFDTTLGRSLLSNNTFVGIFLDKCAFLFNEAYTTEKIIARRTELQEAIRIEMENYDLTRWASYYNLSTNGWNSHCSKIDNYAKGYPEYFLCYCYQYINNKTNYTLTGDEMRSLFHADLIDSTRLTEVQGKVGVSW